MNELNRTGLFAAAALALLATAVWATLPGATPGGFDDQGQPFFPEFTAPEQATSLEVVSIDETTGVVEPFNVKFADGRWVIPSHYDYPADARDRLARTAAGLLDLTKDTIRSDRPEDHRAMGVLDPRDPKLTSLEGLGRRVTVRDASDKVLADLILGKPVPGAEGQRFVRVPGKNRVYGVKLDNVELSTRFADWIETNLLKLQPADVRKVVINDYKIDLDRGVIQPGRPSILERPDSGAKWTINDPPAGKEVDATALGSLTSTLGNLQIVGVRPKPPGLTAELKLSDEEGRALDRSAVQSLSDRGFHVVRGQLLSEEGDVQVACSDGIAYILRFGGVTFARGEALTAGTGEADAPAEGTPEPRPEDAVESRYLFVDAQFDPALIPEPEAHRPWAEGELPDSVFARSASEAQAEAGRREVEAQRAREDYEKKLETGRKRAQELRDRFAAWYYVVPGDAYRKVVLDRDRLLRDPAADAPGGDPAFPGLDGFPAPGGSFPGHGGFPAPGQ